METTSPTDKRKEASLLIKLAMSASVLHFAIPRGRTSPTDFATAAVAAVVVVQLALDQGGLTSSSSEEEYSSEDSAKWGSDYDVTLYFTNPGGRTSPTDFTTGVAAALSMPFALIREDPASSEDFANSESAVASLSLFLYLCLAHYHSLSLSLSFSISLWLSLSLTLSLSLFLVVTVFSGFSLTRAHYQLLVRLRLENYRKGPTKRNSILPSHVHTSTVKKNHHSDCGHHAFEKVWEARSRPGCQGPQRKYARYLSTTSWKLKVSGSRNSRVIREMMRKEMK